MDMLNGVASTGSRTTTLFDDTTFTLERIDGDAKLVITTDDPLRFDAFEGERTQRNGRAALIAPRSARNAAALRECLPWLRPTLLGTRTSAGMGDRLGLATRGHIHAVRATGSKVAPILAQQSIREMIRTNRSAQQVMDDAMWGVFAEDWRDGFGADADHLKTTEDIDRCVDAGFTFFTIDPSAHVDTTADRDDATALASKVAALPWDALESSFDDLRRRYADVPFKLEQRQVHISESAALRAAAKYGQAVAHVAAMYRHLAAKGVPFELEVSVDETDTPTAHAEHIYVASELQRLGVKWVSLAPRYVGSFEKGVEYIGDLNELREDLAGHAEIARAFGGYKLSLHSGSDKFSVYPIIAELTRGKVHLKTAGTSYLEALRVVAMRAPALFREILELARTHYEVDRASYHVSASVDRLPASTSLSDAALSGLLDEHNARQILHVTFGMTLALYGDAIKRTLSVYEDDYADVLERHFVRHLEPFALRATA